MTSEQRKRIVELSLASRKASEIAGRADQHWGFGDTLKTEAEDAYAALMAAIYALYKGAD